MSTNKNLRVAKKNKNDEFYTRLEDIEKELNHYKEHFKDKVIYSPCDDFRKSNFRKYFRENFEALGLRKYICTNKDIGEGAYKYTYDGSVETVDLIENGDFRQQEETRAEADIIITNPPFSQFKDFIYWIGDKDFIVVADKNSFTFKWMFPHIQSGEFRRGYNSIDCFILPDKAGKWHKIVGGYKIAWMQSRERWLTRFPVIKDSPCIELTEYSPERHKGYDNYPAINTDSIKDIPDYDGIIGVPIGIMDCINQERVLNTTAGQFEIIGPLNPYIEGKAKYKRILIKKIKEDKHEN